MTDEEKGYEIIDKRGVKPEDPGTEAEAPQEGTPPQAGEEPSLDDIAAGLPPVDVYTLLKSFIGMLGAQAWQCMGLVKNPSTGNVEKDMAQAKAAIDAIAALAGQLEGRISDREAEELRGMISDLRINFVRQS